VNVDIPQHPVALHGMMTRGSKQLSSTLQVTMQSVSVFTRVCIDFVMCIVLPFGLALVLHCHSPHTIRPLLIQAPSFTCGTIIEVRQVQIFKILVKNS
jgi:hypothetical protein